MGLFGRRKASDEPIDEVSVEAADGEHAAADRVEDPALVDEVDGELEDHSGDEPGEVGALTDGPYDSDDVPAALWAEHLDLGSLRLPRIAGMALQLELDQTQQGITAAVASFGGAAVQLQAFAAPRSEDLWDEIRGEIATSLRAGGGTATDAQGPFGTELHGGMPAGSGRPATPVRFIGVDGGRWFLRAVLSGTASGTGAGSAAIEDLLRQVVVVRDGEARPPRELLPLHAPDLADPEPAPAPAAGARRSSDDLRPFERGPEITEVR